MIKKTKQIAKKTKIEETQSFKYYQAWANLVYKQQQ